MRRLGIQEAFHFVGKKANASKKEIKSGKFALRRFIVEIRNKIYYFFSSNMENGLQDLSKSSSIYLK